MLAKLVSPQRERGEHWTGKAEACHRRAGKQGASVQPWKGLQLVDEMDPILFCTGFNSRSCQVILSWFVQEAALAAETSGDQMEKPGPPCVPANIA